MAWIEPKTNWTPDDMATAEDMNRIFGNIEWLDTHDDYPHVFTEADIVELQEWSEIKDKLIRVATQEEYIFSEPDNRAAYDNFNNVEDILEKIKPQNDARWNMHKANHYSGQGFTAGYQIHCGGHIKDIHDEKYNMYKYNHYCGSYRANSGIRTGGHLR